jgi:hemerythrin-like metal-binding protein
MKNISIQVKANIAIAICILVTLIAGSATLFLLQQAQRDSVVIERVNRHLELSQKSTSQERNRLESNSMDLLARYQKTAQRDSKRLSVVVIAGLVTVSIILILLGLYIRKDFIKPAHTIQRLIRNFTLGNLDVRLNINKTDEMGQIEQLINDLGDMLKRILGEIIGTSGTISSFMDNLKSSADVMGDSTAGAKGKSNTIAASANEISTNISSMAEAAKQAFTNVSTISETIEKFSLNMNTVAGAAEQASTNMSGISTKVTHISKEISGITTSVEGLSESLNNINKNTSHAMQYSEETTSGVEETLNSMNELVEVTQEISKILKLVNDIASQTNMLALNATIEAASAGEAGKGFAVVAGEIKELAKQTTDANGEIARQIKQVQEYVSKSQNQVQNISKVFNQVSELNQGISSLVEEQTQNSIQLVRAIDSVANAAKDSAVNIEEIATGIKEITLSTAEAFKGSQETARSVNETAVGVKEIARSSAVTAAGIGEINHDIQSINTAINELSQTIDLNKESLIDFSHMTEALEQSVMFFTENSSTFFFWTEQLLVNNSRIDKQHQQIVASINDIYNHIRQNSDKTVLIENFVSLFAITETHFKDEQQLFESTAYPDSSSHIETHNTIIVQLQEFQEKLQQGSEDVDEAIMVFFKNWLLKHILTVDRTYIPYCSDGE